MTDDSAPDGWHWGIGERAGGSRTYWLYSNLRFHYQAEMYTDPGQHWTVAFYEETGLRSDGDVRVADHPCRHATFSAESDALEWLHNTATELIDY